MRIAVCDDERAVREYIAGKISFFDGSIGIDEYESGDSLLEGDTGADIIFLDVQMPGTDGMMTAKKLRERGCDAVIIFVSGESGHVFKAFDVGAFNYLVKPFDNAKFYEVLQKAINQVKNADVNEKPERLSEGGSGAKSSPEGRSIVVKSGRAHIRVMLDEVLFAEVINRKVTLYTVNGSIEYYGRLSELSDIAGDDFVRPHRAFLVNMKYIVSYDSEWIRLSGERIPVARGRHAEFVKAYLRYNARRMGNIGDG